MANLNLVSGQKSWLVLFANVSSKYYCVAGESGSPLGPENVETVFLKEQLIQNLWRNCAQLVGNNTSVKILIVF